MATSVFFGLVGLVRLITAIALLRLAAQKNLPNLRWLAFAFLTNVIDLPFTAAPYVPFVDKAISYITYLCFAIFIARTFYRNKRSPLIPFWAVFSLLYIVMFWLTSQFMTELTGISFPQNILAARPDAALMSGSETIDSIIYGSLQISIWLWHAIAGFQASRAISGDSHVENWVKGRYQLIVTYSCLQALVGVAMIGRPFLPSITLILTLLLVISTTSMQFLVWVMPEWFRLWLNREQRIKSDDEQQPLSVMDVFGAAMTDNTGLKSMACFYAIRATVAKRIGSEDSTTIRAHINSMSYREWDAILKHSELRRILINGGADQPSADRAIKNAQEALVEKQSFLTVGAH